MLRNIEYGRTRKIIRNVPFAAGSNILHLTQKKKCDELYLYMVEKNLSEIDYNLTITADL